MKTYLYLNYNQPHYSENQIKQQEPATSQTTPQTKKIHYEITSKTIINSYTTQRILHQMAPY